MKANELRIGNRLNHNDGHNIGAFTVELVHIDDIVRNNEYAKQYEPIPLTEEWLVRFGFKYYKHWDYWQIKGDNRLKVYPRGNGFYYMVAHHFEIKHVHQLQNLYFALTGEELNLHK